ncbi:MBL fold metallo-hydrolase [Oceanimonas sp. CHS3-5]|uniref:MBL fold metallo-hydrolase n=1 Tax=Oceanimonas sp. CHS3-5 TaxID=3068186 RepID=UPI00273FB5B7|nr:MBL fold metallo-hydrolase [Oceanimonas sp. CHS3-5]MDP5292880.1 MBL fold metallo-hydrolase [Oceanimonas sp. CHS3-5]
MNQPCVRAFLDQDSETFSYVLYDQPGGRAAVIDPVLDFNYHSGRTGTATAQRLVDFIGEQRLTLDWILETHAHADHLSAAPFIQQQLGGRIAIGEHIREVQGIFQKVFGLEKELLSDGSQFDHLFADGEQFAVGELSARVMHVPGHTPADIAYVVNERTVFVGDTLFMPDLGTARCDFPGGSAERLYQSVQRLLALPESTDIYVCHDYPPKGREHACRTTVAEQKQGNIHVRDGVGQAAFVTMRTERDATLAVPRLILPSIQVNIRAGRLPDPDEQGRRYLKVPLDSL